MASRKINFKKIVNRLILFISIGVGAHIIFVLSTTEKSLLSYLEKFTIWHILLIMFLVYLPWMFYALRVFIWSKFLNEQISYKTLLRIVITSEMASALSPAAVGGAPVKAALLVNFGFSTSSAGFLLTYGMIEDIVFYTTGILMATFFSGNILPSIISHVSGLIVEHGVIISLVVAFLLIYIYLSRSGRIPRRMKIWTYLKCSTQMKILRFRVKIKNEMSALKQNFRDAAKSGKLVMMVSVTLLFLQWFAKFSVLLVILHAFGIDFDTIDLYLRQWIVYATMLFVPTPGATGGAEASFLLIFGKSIPSALSFLIVSVWRLFTYYFVLLSAVLFYNLITYVFKEPTKDLVIEDGE